MNNIDKVKLSNAIQYVKLSDSIYDINERINEILNELSVLVARRNDNEINQNTNFRKDKDYKAEIEAIFTKTTSFQEVEQILKDNGIEYRLSYRNHLTNDGQNHWSEYYCEVNDVSFTINITEWEECIEEGDYYVDPVIEDKYAEPIFKCYSIG